MILHLDHAAIAEAAQIILRHGLIAFRTDTFYGLGADPFDRGAVRRIKELKGRDDGKPILVLISDLEQVDRFIAEASPAFIKLREQFWPGPLTLIGVSRAEVPEEITAGTGTIGVRLPDDEAVRMLVRACGGALTATSANPSAKAPAKTAPEVADYFPSGIDLIIDGGAARLERPSTVVDARVAEVRLVREGAILQDEIRRAIGS